MPRKTDKKRADDIRNLWINLVNTWYKKWRERNQKSYDFALNSQLTNEEENDLEDAGMPTFIINRIMPIVEIVKYFCTSRNPKWQAVGVDGSDSDIAHIYATVAEYDWYHSNGKSVLSNVMTNCLTKSIGYIFIDIDPDADRGKGEVRFSCVDTWDVYVDPRARDIFFRDAGVIMIKKDFPRSHLLNKLPQFKNKIMRASGEDDDATYSSRDVDDSDSIQYEDVRDNIYPGDGSEEDLLPYYETYRKKKVPFYNLYIANPPSKEELVKAESQADMIVKEFARELAIKTKEMLQEWDAAVQLGQMLPERREFELDKLRDQNAIKLQEKRQLVMSRIRDELTRVEQKIVSKEEYDILIKDEEIADKIIDSYEYFETRIHKECAVGDKFLYEELEEHSEYRIIPLPFHWTGTPFPMSFVVPLIGKQQEINKSHQIMIHHANLSSNLRWKYVEGEIDEDEWESNSTAPGGLLKYRPGLSQQGPMEVMPQPINNAFYTITKEGESDLEYLAGIQPSVMGITKDQPETYRGLLASDEYGTRRIRQWISNVLEPWFEQVGKIHAMVSTKHYDVQKVFRLVQPEDGQPKQTTAEVNIPLYDDFGAIVGRYNDYTSIKFDVRFIPGSTMPLNRWALLEEYLRLFELQIVDDIEVREHTDVRNKSALNERFSAMARLQSALEARDEEIKSLKGDVDTLRRQLLQQGLKVDQAALREEEFKKTTEVKAKKQKELDKLGNDISIAGEAMKLEQERAKLEAQKKKDKKS